MRVLNRLLARGFGGDVVIDTPIALPAGAALDLRGRTLRPGGDNVLGLLDLRAGGITVTCGLGLAVLDGRGQCPLWITDENTDNLTIQRVIGRRGSAVGAWDTNLLGGIRATQTGGGHVVEHSRFEEMRLSFAGVGHTIRATTFARSPEVALHRGARPLAWDKPNENGASGTILEDLYFDSCGTTWNSTTDDGVLYMGRRWASGCLGRRISWRSCQGVALYLDDMDCLDDFLDLRFVSCGRDLLVGGGYGNRVRGAVSTGAAQPSIWDDRASAQNGTGGSRSGSYNNGAWHSVFHAASEWSHGPVAGEDNGAMGVIIQELAHVNAGGATAWLAEVNARFAEWGIDLATLSALDDAYVTTGEIDYSYSGGTPAIQNGYSQALASNAHTGLIGRINGSPVSTGA